MIKQPAFKQEVRAVEPAWRPRAAVKVMVNRKLRRNLYTAGLPRITLVTPCFNHAEFVEAALLSVLEQGYPNLEYVVMDGGSRDGSAEIIQRHRDYLSRWESKPDGGQYHAINEGFAGTTGGIMGWLNSDDMLHTNALWTASEIFATLPEVEWITGLPTAFDTLGRVVMVKRRPPRWSRRRILAGDHRWIQQESVFWRRSLWEKSGAHLDTRYGLAADFELWVRFFRHAQLHTAQVPIGGFRMSSPRQRSRALHDQYMREVHEILQAERILAINPLAHAGLTAFHSATAKLPNLGPPFERLRTRVMQFPSIIVFDAKRERFVLKESWERLDS